MTVDLLVEGKARWYRDVLAVGNGKGTVPAIGDQLIQVDEGGLFVLDQDLQAADLDNGALHPAVGGKRRLERVVVPVVLEQDDHILMLGKQCLSLLGITPCIDNLHRAPSLSYSCCASVSCPKAVVAFGCILEMPLNGSRSVP